MAAYVRDTDFFTRRTAVLAAIIGLHVFIAWALATGLARKAIEVLAPPIQTDIVQEEKNKAEPPPPPPPELRKEVVEVPPPDINIAMPEVGPQTNAITARVEQPKAPAPAPKAAVAGTAIGLGKGFPNVDDYYPDASRRLGEEGLTMVDICVGPDGKLTEPPKVGKSSGHERLDQAAVKVASVGSGRFKPATEEGKPVTKCTQLPIRFKLHN
ncbi:MAG: TonB family protein [Gammaproteobacteria bacterium]|nr:TonB family protein [Gammaproteobacteria bacterium]MBV9725055.1 TonB family protein [Gammaproteobacteria bacterium]